VDIDPAEEARGLYVAYDPAAGRAVLVMSWRPGMSYRRRDRSLGPLLLSALDTSRVGDQRQRRPFRQPAGMWDFQADPVELQAYLVSLVGLATRSSWNDFIRRPST